MVRRKYTRKPKRQVKRTFNSYRKANSYRNALKNRGYYANAYSERDDGPITVIGTPYSGPDSTVLTRSYRTKGNPAVRRKRRR